MGAVFALASGAADVATARQAFLAGDYVGAYQAMKAGTSPFCEVVRGALGSVGHGKDATEERVFELALDAGASTTVAGLMLAAIGIGTILGDVPAAWLANRVGS